VIQFTILPWTLTLFNVDIIALAIIAALNSLMLQSGTCSFFSCSLESAVAIALTRAAKDCMSVSMNLRSAKRLRFVVEACYHMISGDYAQYLSEILTGAKGWHDDLDSFQLADEFSSCGQWCS